MSIRELARTLLDEMPDNDLIYLVAYMQSLKALKDAEIPNAKTQTAIDEVDSMIRTGKGDTLRALLPTSSLNWRRRTKPC
jgi:hypothetical protein